MRTMPGRAEAALERSVVGERVGDPLERGRVAESLDREDVAPVGLRREVRARAHGAAVDEDGARAADLDVARALGAGEAQAGRAARRAAAPAARRRAPWGGR